MIRRRYLLKCFNLASRRFSNCVRFNCCNKSLHLIKYVLACFLAAAIPIDVARCVFPTPLGPKNTIFSFFSRKPRLASSYAIFLQLQHNAQKYNSILLNLTDEWLWNLCYNTHVYNHHILVMRQSYQCTLVVQSIDSLCN